MSLTLRTLMDTLRACEAWMQYYPYGTAKHQYWKYHSYKINGMINDWLCGK